MINVQLYFGVKECVEQVEVEVNCAKRYYIELYLGVEECLERVNY